MDADTALTCTDGADPENGTLSLVSLSLGPFQFQWLWLDAGNGVNTSECGACLAGYYGASSGIGM